MSFVDSNLVGDEVVLYRGHVTLWALLPWIVWGVIIAVFTYGIGLLLIPFGYFMLLTNEAAVTSKKLIAKTGFIRRDTVEIPISKVSSLRVRQGVFGRILGFGTLIISDSGSAHAPVRYIKNPLKFRRRFFEIQEGKEHPLERHSPVIDSSNLPEL
ncbi:TPA: PH domain-containing protein [Salmonella enterica]|uniref:PH domain-containing protein n=1 Tax=Salmonella enterica TaxID=28901 RepID=A0A749ZA71_SALER|nr:PH domain-containing protein [Salmonella enterica subsp. enterica serovar Richmond]EBV2339633.1 PH domain-containing protein [Salmonella enterica subsp. enterica serovar Potsdam]ECF2421956.1 PH domain-containing protein [Salmonella enterica subsp. enterica serovar Newport]ECJ6129001.1 PH domain-containing protein [Salmonella enterica]EBX4073671.1 PH domain-containing protein [Salmonella enterica subsp. enterica serovar Richmond]